MARTEIGERVEERPECAALPVGVQRGRHDKHARQEALLRAAAAVFAREGYDAARTREIAARAGCAEGLIHRYFGGKEGLLIALLDRYEREIAPLFCTVPADEAPLREEIEALLLRPLRLLGEEHEITRVAVARAVTEASPGSELARKLAARLHGERVAQIAARLRARQQAGQIAADVDIAAAADVIAGLGFFLAFTRIVLMGGDPQEAAALARVGAQLFAAGLTPSQRT
jgi:AcrR family transcriptional regulator